MIHISFCVSLQLKRRWRSYRYDRTCFSSTPTSRRTSVISAARCCSDSSGRALNAKVKIQTIQFNKCLLLVRARSHCDGKFLKYFPMPHGHLIHIFAFAIAVTKGYCIHWRCLQQRHNNLPLS